MVKLYCARKFKFSLDYSRLLTYVALSIHQVTFGHSSDFDHELKHFS
jgi:hypothetical protein